MGADHLRLFEILEKTEIAGRVRKEAFACFGQSPDDDTGLGSAVSAMHDRIGFDGSCAVGPRSMGMVVCEKRSVLTTQPEALESPGQASSAAVRFSNSALTAPARGDSTS